MNASAFDTLKAAQSLRAAGFDDAQAEAVVATIDSAVREHTEPLANGIAAVANSMATKDAVETVTGRVESISGSMATKDAVETVTGRVESISESMATKDAVESVERRLESICEVMATKEYVQAAIAVEMKTLYRHLWVMGTSAVGVTVALVKLLP